jgi:A/G-specific adenine glycosylase
LLEWFFVHGRRLPWRQAPSAYGTWISEIMLQQTQVATVIPYYERFMARFPDIRSLAQAELADVLALWQGLGYYARARHMHQAARDIVRLYDGEIPRTRQALVSLPGIGAYTAGAILSIAYNQDYVAVDGNVKRILARILDHAGNIAASSTVQALEACAQALLPSGQAGAFNQALMDLGATICVPRNPLCDRCPVARFCLARQRGVQELRPVRTRRAPVPLRRMVGAYVERDDGHWLVVRRRPTGLLGGLWELPAFAVESPQDAPLDQTLREALQRDLALAVEVYGPPTEVTHTYSHFRVQQAIYRCRPRSEAVLQTQDTWDAFHWLDSAQAPAYGLTGVTVKALRSLRETQLPLL